MPVYVRKNLLSITPDSLTNLSSDEDDFLTDPDQIIDRLPQPFRLINKLLLHIFDRAWEQISIREEVRIKEAARSKVPQYECANQLRDLGKVRCMKESPGGQYIFVGLATGVAVLDARQHTILARWEQNVEIGVIEISVIGIQNYLIVTIDELGLLRVFFYAFDGLHFFRILNEQDGMKTLAFGITLSNEAEYMAVSMLSNEDVWLDVLKLPKDNWQQELETANNNVLKHRGSLSKVKIEQALVQDTATDQPIEVCDTLEQTSGITLERSSSKHIPISQGQSMDVVTESTTKISDIKAMNVNNLSKPVTILRVRPPPGFTGIPNCTPQTCLSRMDDGTILGSGTKHLITETHGELRSKVFEQLHETELKYLKTNEAETPKTTQSLCVFLNAGRMLPTGLETSSAGHPNSIVVAWSGSTNLYFYNLLKQAKDIEHKAELVWPHSSPITVLSTTPCTSFLGIGQQDGSLLVWDNNYGIPVKVQKISKHGFITYIKFLSASTMNELSSIKPPASRTFRVLVGCNDGSLVNITCGESKTTEAVTLVDRSSYEIEKFSYIEAFPLFPHVIVTVRKTGAVMFYDAVKGKEICEVTLPSSYQLSTPWSPVITLAANGQMLFIKANEVTPDKEYMLHDENISIFVYQLCSFLPLDNYWQNIHKLQPFSVPIAADKRIDAYLAERLANQNKRQVRMQGRWSEIKADVDAVQKCYHAKVDKNVDR